jgi:hypothetical protein
MRASRPLRRLLPLLAFALAGHAMADAPCRVAYDIGSSGVRAGASNSGMTTRAGIDYLAALRQNGSLDATVEPTIAALTEPFRKGLFEPSCARVGGGFSAWRLALQDVGKLIPDLTRIRAATGVAVIVVPQNVEGSYGYLGARRLLGERLRTSHVLDIGGGSLQVAGERSSFGAAIGQKLWHQQACEALGKAGGLPCRLSPMTADQLAAARALLASRLENAGASLHAPVTMTAISRPVTHGVAPAVERLLDKPQAAATLSRADLGQAIALLAGMTLEDTAARLGVAQQYAAYLLSDMLLVEGLMQAGGAAELQIADIELTNIPGLLADDIAYRWADNYGCYLLRLARDGLGAYASDPGTCGAAGRSAGKPGRALQAAAPAV